MKHSTDQQIQLMFDKYHIFHQWCITKFSAFNLITRSTMAISMVNWIMAVPTLSVQQPMALESSAKLFTQLITETNHGHLQQKYTNPLIARIKALQCSQLEQMESRTYILDHSSKTYPSFKPQTKRKGVKKLKITVLVLNWTFPKETNTDQKIKK